MAGARVFVMAVFAMLTVIGVSAGGWAHPPAEHDRSGSGPVTHDAPPSSRAAETDASASPSPDTASEISLGHSHADAGMEPDTAHDHGDAPSAPVSGHAHWGEDGASTPFERLMSRIGVFHSVAVHFPIALVLAAAFAQALFLFGRFPAGPETVRFLVWTGAASGVLAVFLGWAHSGPMASGEAGVMLAHRVLGTGLLAGLGGLALLAEWVRRDSGRMPSLLFSLGLFGVAAALMLNGFLGGALAHGGLRHLLGG